MDLRQLYVSGILLAFLASSCNGHKDGAYMRNADDGFNKRNNWMAQIRNNVQLRELAMPGTHDSGTFRLDIDKLPDVSKTQILSFDEQLNYGVRMFDVRIRHISNAFALHHGIVYLNVNFDDFLSSVTSFLKSNPSETVLFRLKEDHTAGDDNTRSMADTLQDYMNKYKNYFLRTSDSSITLGKARGKFIILADNSQFSSFGLSYSSSNIQDKYQLNTNWDLYKKWESIKEQLENARNGNPSVFYLNFLSGSGGSFPYFVASGHSSSGTTAPRLSTGLTTPGWKNSYPDFPRVDCFIGICTIAFEGTNILTRDKIDQYNQSQGRRTVGIIIADFPGDSLLSAIIENNKYLRRSGSDSLLSVQKCNKRIIGYYTSWGDKEISEREIKKLTHVIYAFLEMHADGTVEVGSADRKNSANVDEETSKAKKRLENLMEIASDFPHVKVMFAVGGWENSQYFSDVAASSGKRNTFIASVIKLIKSYSFDGVDLDWEYPVTGGAKEGVSADKQNYVLLMKEIRTALDSLANEQGRKDKYLLSFAGAAGQWTLDPGFDLPGLLKYVDFANIMTYDYFGAWGSKWGAYTGPPAPLYFAMPPKFSGKTNTDWTVKYYTCKTKLPHKINMGVPFYGRYWKNVGPPIDGKDGMWRTATKVNGIFEGGYVPYNKIQSEYLNKGFQAVFHDKSKTPYAWNSGTSTFLGYENKKSLQYKVDYAVQKNVGGLMIWAVELDDDDLTLLDTVSNAQLCTKTNPNEINHKCSPINEKRWWTSEDGDDVAGLCGRSAPLYKGYYPVCDPDDPGYSCCGPAGYCGSGDKYCKCSTCKDYSQNPEKILDAPIKPTVPVTWYFLNDADGKRGRCGRKIPQIKNIFPTCNPDDPNAYCCSNGGYCGNTDEHCKCNGCVDFKKNPNYRYGPKKWWELADGKDKAGKCGPNAPKVDGKYEAECEPNTKYSCCSASGYCGSGAEFCDCAKCKKFT